MLGIYLDICGRIYPVIGPSIYPPRVDSPCKDWWDSRVDRQTATAGWIGSWIPDVEVKSNGRCHVLTEIFEKG